MTSGRIKNRLRIFFELRDCRADIDFLFLLMMRFFECRTKLLKIN